MKGQPAQPGPSVALDMQSEKDRGLVRNQAKEAPGRLRAMNEAVADKLVAGMVEATAEARKLLRGSKDHGEKISAIDSIASLARTGVMMIQVQQKDEHHADDMRLKERVADTGEAFAKHYLGLDPEMV